MFRDRLRPRHRSLSLSLCPACLSHYPFLPTRYDRAAFTILAAGPGQVLFFIDSFEPLPLPKDRALHVSREALPAVLNAVPRRFSDLLAFHGDNEGTRENIHIIEEGDSREEIARDSNAFGTDSRSLRFLQRPWVLGIKGKNRARPVMHRFLGIE